MRAIGFQQSGQTSRLTVGFRKGSKPASQGLNPGECSWMDRGMRNSEPDSICQDVTDVFLRRRIIVTPGTLLRIFSSFSLPGRRAHLILREFGSLISISQCTSRVRAGVWWFGIRSPDAAGFKI